MRKVHVIQHVEIEPLGIISDVLERKNIQAEHTHVYRGDTVPTNLDSAGALILMGGPMGANDFAKYPTLLDELRLIGVALERGLPLLGSASAASSSRPPWVNRSIRVRRKRSAGIRLLRRTKQRTIP
ncbi:MAG: hypothetical protein QGG53_10530 [Planctomycetota bacterium]|nr:hypothetical protein [Planctomycetota bacterium]